jgi:hypothetical protein
LQEFPELGRIVLEYRNENIREIIFGHIESCTGSITKQSFVRLHAFGIRREVFRSYKREHRILSVKPEMIVIASRTNIGDELERNSRSRRLQITCEPRHANALRLVASKHAQEHKRSGPH